MDTKQLRQKILDLAIRGKLVPQDPNDEPASVLLERVKAEKERLIAEGKIKRSKKSAASSDKPHYPFEIPDSWEWTTIGEIASTILYGVSESAKESGTFKLLRITDIQNNRVNWQTVPFTNYDEQKAAAYLLRDGDILFARTGATVGKSYLVEGLSEASIYASYLIRVQTSTAILPTYTKLFFESGFYWEQISLNSVGVGQPNVNGTTLASLLMPIPPYQEQKRIVEESKKWLSVIDVLDFELEGLMKSIDVIKSKILDLAINGKLVPQDPADEPAVDLLKRVNPNAVVSTDTSHYGQLPDGWCYTTMNFICQLYDGEKIEDKNLINLDAKYLRGKSEGNTLNKGRLVPEKTTMILVDGENSGEIFTAPINGYQGSTFKLLDISEEMNAEYVKMIIRIYQKRLRDNKVGSAIPHLNKKMFREILVPVPPIAEQTRIVERTNELMSKITELTEAL